MDRRLKGRFLRFTLGRLALGALLMGGLARGASGNDRQVTAGGELTLDNAGLQVGLRQAGSKVWLSRLVDKKDGFNFLAEGNAEYPLWEVTFCARDAALSTTFRGGASGLPVDFHGQAGDLVNIDSLSCGGKVLVTRVAKDPGAMELSWTEVALPDGSKARILVSVAMDKARALSFWTIAVDSASQRYTPWSVRFVGVRGLRRAPDRKDEFFLLPAGAGLRDPAPMENGACEWMYPSSCMGIQMSAYLLAAQRKGFFTACYDPEANTKKFNFAIKDGVRSHFWEHYPENMGASSPKYTVPYPVVLGVFDGDWFEAAQIYKEWGTRQFWTARGKMHETTDIPQWFKEMNLWKRPDGDPVQMRKNMGEFRDWLQAPFCVQWYCWGTVQFDTLTPDFFPARPGFAEAVADMQGRGVAVFPYINGLLWDPKSNEVKKRGGGDQWASKTVEGKKYLYPEASNWWSYHMCPYTEFWRETIHDLALRMAREGGTRGLYFDCVGGLDTKFCFDKTHGHPLGGGHYWYDGFLRMMKSIRHDYRSQVPDAAFTTELMAEPLIGAFDGVLMCTIDSPRLIPLFQAIYGEYILTYGRGERWEDWEQDGCFENREAEAFSFGQQLGQQVGRRVAGGGSENFELDPPYRERSGFFKELIAARQAGAKFLVYGRMAKPLQFKEPLPTVSLLGSYKVFGGGPVLRPVLYQSSWIDPAGHLGLVLVNASRQEVTVAYDLDPAQYGLDAKKPLMATSLYPKADADNQAPATCGGAQVVRVKARSVRIVEISQ